MTLGKFAPFHRGHQHLIEAALREVQRLIVVVYDAVEVTQVPLSVRADWIRELYPAVEVREAWDGPSDGGNTPAIEEVQERYLRKLLAGETISHFFSSEPYGVHVSRAFGARDCRVDPARAAFPISGTAVRADPYRYRRFLDPRVYRDLVTWVVLLGAPSTGKTTLARGLAREHQTNWMPEYGREYWEAHQQERRLTADQLLELAAGHRAREEAIVREARGVLFVDTDATTTVNFARDYGVPVPARLEAYAAESVTRYDLHFLCGDDIPYEETWDRSGVAHRTTFQKRIRADLLQRGIPFITLTGSIEKRMETVNRVLKRFKKWTSLADRLVEGD